MFRRKIKDLRALARATASDNLSSKITQLLLNPNDKRHLVVGCDADNMVRFLRNVLDSITGSATLPDDPYVDIDENLLQTHDYDQMAAKISNTKIDMTHLGIYKNSFVIQGGGLKEGRKIYPWRIVLATIDQKKMIQLQKHNILKKEILKVLETQLHLWLYTQSIQNSLGWAWMDTP